MAPYEKSREVDLSPWGIEAKARVKRFTQQEKAACQRELSRAAGIKVKFDKKGKPLNPDIDPSFLEDSIWAAHGLTEAPFALDMETIKQQDFEMIEHISREVQSINSYFFLKPLETDEDETDTDSDGTLPDGSDGPCWNGRIVSRRS